MKDRQTETGRHVAAAGSTPTRSAMDEQDALRHRLEELRVEHRDLDEAIDRLADSLPFDQLKLQRMKKRKLILKDEIANLEDQLLPDIIA